jgi:hypothetical protein
MTIHADAELELRQAVARYESQREGLGREFRLDFEEAVARIHQAPGLLPTIDQQGTRERRFARFPFTV